MSSALLVDIDNTLYDWPAFFAPSFRAMVHALSRELAMGEEDLYNECKSVFGRHESLEYAFLIQELESVRGLPNDRIRELIRVGRGAFNSVSRKRLVPYEGVVETLRWLQLQQIPAIGITNSPVNRAQRRLYDLGIDRLLAGLVAWEGFEVDPSDDVTKGFVPAGHTSGRTRLSTVIAIPLASCKPSEAHYSVALEALRIEPEAAWAMGDSLAKDLEPAARLGVRTIWAKYGSGFDPMDVNNETLLRITHWDSTKIASTYHDDSFQPTMTVDRFSDIEEFLPASVLPLF